MSTPLIYILNGPNLNMLGTREPDIYGLDTLANIEAACEERASALGMETDFRQSNLEGELVTWIQEAREDAAGIILNAAAYSHTSLAIHDALRLLDVPILEVHFSNVFKRESLRHHSHVASVADGVICGLGAQGYLLALDAMARLLDKDD